MAALHTSTIINNSAAHKIVVMFVGGSASLFQVSNNRFAFRRLTVLILWVHANGEVNIMAAAERPGKQHQSDAVQQYDRNGVCDLALYKQNLGCNADEGTPFWYKERQKISCIMFQQRQPSMETT